MSKDVNSQAWTNGPTCDNVHTA